MGTAATVTANTAVFTSATAVIQSFANDVADYVTFTTSSTIPSPPGPYKLFTITWGGSYASYYPLSPVMAAVPCPEPGNSRTAAQAGAAAALDLFTIPNGANTAVDVYCWNTPTASTAYDIGVCAITGL